MNVTETHDKPLDFGAEGVTGSLDVDGRIIALNMYHPVHGYVSLTAAEPFPESQRYDATAVRAYRASLAHLSGFGLHFHMPVVKRESRLLESAVPFIQLTFANGATASITTLASAEGVIQIWEVDGITAYWQGRLCLQRCAYTQLTEGGPLPMPPLKMDVTFRDGALYIENTPLGAAVVMTGLGVGPAQEYHVTEPIDLRLGDDAPSQRLMLVYGVGTTVAIAENHARQLQERDTSRWLDDTLARWRGLWETVPDDPLVRRGLVYGLSLAIPAGEGICFLTDHMLLPLSWNRDAYYVARALLRWNSVCAETVRRHLLWMFEIAERHHNEWARCYLANGRIKDSAFQLDQQLFPLLELAEYVLETGDRDTFARLSSHVERVLDGLIARKAAFAMLFPTDETPGDDPIAFPYHLSSHLLFWRVLMKLDALKISGVLRGIAAELREAIDRYFIAEHDGRQLYAYATDGAGHHHFYHDANDLPLALAPLWGIMDAKNPIWQATVQFAFSDANVGGAYHGRLGSVHTRAPWTLGDVQALIVAQLLGDTSREQQIWDNLRAAAQRDGALPEAYDSQTSAVVSRYWFAWPNAALACVIMKAFD